MIRTALLLLLVVFPLCLHAQDEALVVSSGKKYVAVNIRSLDKYARRIQKQQQRLLKKLKRKEDRLAAKLQKKDSAAYVQYREQELSYDSISRLLKPDSATLIARAGRKANKTVDSLRAVQSFIQSKANTVSDKIPAKDGELNSLQQQLSYNDYISDLIGKRTAGLRRLGAKGNINALTGIQKDVFYAKAKMQEWKKMSEEPSRLEEKALEYLQGTAGFDEALGKATNSSGISPGMSADDLEKRGYQTKRQVNAALQQKFGDNLSGMQQQVGDQIGDWQDKAKGLTTDIKQAKTEVQQAKQSVTQLRKPDKPSFKINPMRGLPLSGRIEKSYSFQTARATADRPALLQLAGMAGFRHTPKLTCGLGVASSFGLGQGWSSIRFSFEGIGWRSYAEWKLRYGIGAYAGYERLYKEAAFQGKGSRNAEQVQLYPSPHNTATYSESVLLGLTKSYRISSRWNGTLQVLYDVWWAQNGMKTPVVLRLVTSK